VTSLLCHPDHIVAVYEGGGACELDNLRTLCTACHHDVTAAQARSRAALRTRQRLGCKDIRELFGAPPSKVGCLLVPWAPAAAAAAAAAGGVVLFQSVIYDCLLMCCPLQQGPQGWPVVQRAA
jgi:hypothetical protein